MVEATLLGHALLSDIRPRPCNRGFTVVINLLTPSENSTALPPVNPYADCRVQDQPRDRKSEKPSHTRSLNHIYSYGGWLILYS